MGDKNTRLDVKGMALAEGTRWLVQDLSFSVNGALYGCFSCEQISATHEWSPYQVKLLRRMASRVSLALMHTITTNVDTQPGALCACRLSSCHRMASQY